MQVVSIDLGSNTLRLLLYDCKEGRAIATYERMVKTADGLAQSGLISKEAIERIVGALAEAKGVIDYDRYPTIAITTEALRQAKNGQEALDEIAQRSGVGFRIIDERSEALLTLEATKSRLDILGIKERYFLLIDIGGGSSEVTFVKGDEVRSKSFKIGIVTLAQKAGNLEGVKRLLPQLCAEAKRFIDGVTELWGKPQLMVATAGTPTTVAAMKLGMDVSTYDPERINGTSLYYKELEYYLNRLLSMPKEERERVVGVGRDELIAAGILIFKAFFEMAGVDKAIIVDDGLREGAAIDYCNRLKSKK